jgi:hypothetical protein
MPTGPTEEWAFLKANAKQQGRAVGKGDSTLEFNSAEYLLELRKSPAHQRDKDFNEPMAAPQKPLLRGDGQLIC